MHKYETFQTTLELAQSGDRPAVEHILCQFKPLIKKYSYVSNAPDDDLHSILLDASLSCINRFKYDKDDMEAFIEEAKKFLQKQ